ncbi:DUF6082 family protein [Streptomyces sp. Tue6028]|uniref:DUF6082 family protein n=1 Tax=Streptomyces sp. Tue6028 TaxID=2036037 RepID=UPI003D74FDC8
MTDKAPTEQVIRQMLAGVFEDAASESLQEAAENIAGVGLHRAPTIEDVEAFVRQHAQPLGLAPRRRQRVTDTLAARLRKVQGLVYEEAAAAIERIQASRDRAAAASRTTKAREPERPVAGPLRSGGDIAAAYRMRLELLMKAIDDPELAATLDAYEAPVSAARLRQYLFSDALYIQLLLAYRTGTLSLEELQGKARPLLRNAIFRDYWEASRHQRSSLPDGSEERMVGRMIDALAQDMDAADMWWTVDSPPEEHN